MPQNYCEEEHKKIRYLLGQQNRLVFGRSIKSVQNKSVRRQLIFKNRKKKSKKKEELEAEERVFMLKSELANTKRASVYQKLSIAFSEAGVALVKKIVSGQTMVRLEARALLGVGKLHL